jgi:hypothetical protein
MPKNVTCDICGKPGEEDYNGSCFCDFHAAIDEISNLKAEIKRKREWLLGTHIKDLLEMMAELKVLEEYLKENKK